MTIKIDMKHKPLIDQFNALKDSGELEEILFDANFHLYEDGKRTGLWVLKVDSDDLDPKSISQDGWEALHTFIVFIWRKDGMLEKDGIDDLAIGISGPNDGNTANMIWDGHVSTLAFAPSQDVNADFEKLTSLEGVKVDAQGNHSVPKASFEKSPLALAMLSDTSGVVH